MMSFKDMVKADNSAVFLNTEEFAEFHTVKYDGEIYEHIPVIVQNLKESDKVVSALNKSEGFYRISAKAYLNIADLGGILPERGHRFRIDNGEALGEVFYDDYKIITSSLDEGMVILELELFDE